MEFFFLIILIALVGGIVAYYGYLAEKRRREALAELARSLGWRFRPGKDSSHDERYAQFSIFRQGHSRVALNALNGELEIDGRRYPAQAGDFRYKITSSNGKTTTTHTYDFSYLIVQLPFPHVPSLLIRREGFFDKLASFFGFSDVEFESAEFNRAFRVQSSDKKFAYDVVHQRMMEFLMKTDPPTIDMEHSHLCLSDGKYRWEPAEFERHIAWVQRFFDQWPDFVKRDLAQGRLPVG